MAEKDTIKKGKIKQEGVFNFKELYEFIYKSLKDEGYKVNEKTYSEKITGDSKELQIVWQAKKKVSDYFKFVINMHWLIVGMKKIKVKKENKEVSTNSGLVEIRFEAVLVKDYESKWEDAPSWKFLRGVYDRYIIRSRIDQYEDDIEDELEEFIAQIKSFLALEGKR